MPQTMLSESPDWVENNRENHEKKDIEMEPLKLKWEVVDHILQVQGKECLIWIEPRPHYCDRGNYIAKIDARGKLAEDLDSADRWPRYYFDLGFAQREVEAWLVKRKQALVTPDNSQ